MQHGVLPGTPNSHVGTHNVVLKATDAAGAVDTQSFTITVNNVNDTTITSTAVTSVNEDSAYSYTFVANDVDMVIPNTLCTHKTFLVIFNANTVSYLVQIIVMSVRIMSLKATDAAGC